MNTIPTLSYPDPSTVLHQFEQFLRSCLKIFSYSIIEALHRSSKLILINFYTCWQLLLHPWTFFYFPWMVCLKKVSSEKYIYTSADTGKKRQIKNSPNGMWIWKYFFLIIFFVSILFPVFKHTFFCLTYYSFLKLE